MLLHINVPGSKYKVPLTMELNRTRLKLKFGYNKKLIEEVKNLEGRKWHPDGKYWSIPEHSQRNKFVFEYLLGNNPYKNWRQAIDPNSVNTFRTLYNHQKLLAAHILTVRHGVWGSEMGTGKTLAAITAMECSGIKHWWWIGTRSSLQAVKYEFAKWNTEVIPHFESYHMLRKVVENWTAGDPAPQGIIFDESSKIKNPNAQMSKAAKHITDSMRDEYGMDAIILLMSGSPAPKDPSDWWHQCEVACPGYLKEGNKQTLLKRLAFIESAESLTGGMFPKFKAWYDGNAICKRCGCTKDQHTFFDKEACGTYVEAANEIFKFYKRMQGLVQVQLKKDCLDLPDKRYEIIELEPTASLRQTARTMIKTAKNQLTAMMIGRTLSDGFLYKDVKIGEKECEACAGKKVIIDTENNEMNCSACNGTGKMPITERQTISVDCPKIDALTSLLERHEEVGRVVIYAGFTGSVDRCVETCRKAMWHVIRVDGRGWFFHDHMGQKVEEDEIKAFQEMQGIYPRIAFVGQPGAAGMGLTLTASPSIIYYSNDFNAESRIQSEDRIHRPGMDTNRGATIYDLCHLGTDKIILDNLKKKRQLQSVSMGEVEAALC